MIKTQKKSKWRFIWVIPILLLTLTAIIELLGTEALIKEMTKKGMSHMLNLLALLKLICVFAFLIPKTRRIGFLLCTAYIGGIIASNWMTHEPPIPGIVLQTLLWIGAYFEFPDYFKPLNKQQAINE
ncbi:hypothetical protein [Kordia jejudonensis]|uniref:hypothetical protein n=1 Tax=Kordia jejudonensis TaxID=1348245 RepID=UPI000629A0F0|nr:hypothetical protein [Kordia jejudonensis]